METEREHGIGSGKGQEKVRKAWRGILGALVDKRGIERECCKETGGGEMWVETKEGSGLAVLGYLTWSCDSAQEQLGNLTGNFCLGWNFSSTSSLSFPSYLYLSSPSFLSSFSSSPQLQDPQDPVLLHLQS
jgi:hypothetical protein